MTHPSQSPHAGQERSTGRLTFRDCLALCTVGKCYQLGWRAMDKIGDAGLGAWTLPVNFIVSGVAIAVAALIWRAMMGKGRWS